MVNVSKKMYTFNKKMFQKLHFFITQPIILSSSEEFWSTISSTIVFSLRFPLYYKKI